ncbi:MAG: fumarylacetoacetate hydrolase family protein [Actinobacteria bacterium]|nr:fumarylacetoacetate hydrolase family protein [Actinomycetota bacterium]
MAVAVGDSPPIDLISAWNEVTGTRLTIQNGHPLVSTLRLIEEGPEVWSEVNDVAKAASDLPWLRVDLEDPRTRLLCPLDFLASLKDFLAFEDHVKNGAERRNIEVPPYWYKAPVYYKGNRRAVIGPDEECRWPRYTDYLDFELELAMIIGRRGRDVTAEGAGEHIFGFTVFNDFSARDVQMLEGTAWLGPGKGKDFANSFGPCIVTADEVGTEPDLEMICRVNGEEWGRSRSSTAHWKWQDMIAHCSDAEDIYPGDVYGSGTPGGCCGLDLGRRLEPGDVIELEIEKIGILRNTIGARPTSAPAAR